jgi:hypothetical protein
MPSIEEGEAIVGCKNPKMLVAAGVPTHLRIKQSQLDCFRSLHPMFGGVVWRAVVYVTWPLCTRDSEAKHFA